MGLFSTLLCVYEREQSDIVDALKRELKEAKKLNRFDRIGLDNNNFEEIIESEVYSKSGVFYLITERRNKWTTILELNVNIDDPFYLYDIVNGMSLRLKTYCLSFHLHDDDVVLYNLENNGNSLDGYNSDIQYFEDEPLKRSEIISQRHNPIKFLELLPHGKNVAGLNEILDRGYWQAFDNNDLDSDGIPSEDKYDVDEEQRLKDIGQYLEIHSADDFPYANWNSDIYELDLTKCYLLRADY